MLPRNTHASTSSATALPGGHAGAASRGHHLESIYVYPDATLTMDSAECRIVPCTFGPSTFSTSGLIHCSGGGERVQVMASLQECGIEWRVRDCTGGVVVSLSACVRACRYMAAEYRRALVAQELLGFNADIMCLQEVDEKAFAIYFAPLLRLAGASSRRDYAVEAWQGVVTVAVRVLPVKLAKEAPNPACSIQQGGHLIGCRCHVLAACLTDWCEDILHFSPVASRV